MPETHEKPAEQLSQEARTVLIVDDEPIILKALDKFLSRFNYRVILAEHAVDAMKILRETTVGVIITDYQMPMLSGLEFLNQVKKIQPLATRILITAIQDNETVIEAINDGEIFRFITKPWKGEDLLATIHNAAQKYELSRRNHDLQLETQQVNQSLHQKIEALEQQKKQLELLNRSLKDGMERAVRLCVRVLETSRPVPGGRARKVQVLATAIGKELRFSSTDLHDLSIAALLHEIGLVNLPADVVTRSEAGLEKLSADELQTFRNHPVFGAELAGCLDDSGGISAIIRSHCENFDGSGFPDGRDGEFIPLPAAVLAVASFMVKSKRDMDATLAEMTALSGKRFHPEVVRAVTRAISTLKALRTGSRQSLLLSELQPGMVLAEPVLNTQGTLLLPEGEKLTDASITLLVNHDRISPIQGQIYVIH